MHYLKTAFYISFGLKKISLNYMTMKYILKAINNATSTSDIIPINISLSKFLVKNDKFIKFFGNHIKS